MRLYQGDPEIVKQYFLMHSSPEFIHNFIEKLILEEGHRVYNQLISEEIEIKLLKRKEPIINLVLSKYGYSREIFNSLYQDAPEAIKLALLSNAHIFTDMKIQQYLRQHNSWMSLIEVEELVKENNSLALFIFFSNPHVDSDLLNNLYDKTSLFENVDEKLWRLLIHYTAKNKKVYDRNIMYEYSSIDFEKIWNLTKRVLPNEDWADTLHALLQKIPRRKVINDDHTLQEVLQRWNISNKKEPSDYHCCFYCNLAFCDPFEEVMLCIADSYSDTRNQELLGEKLFKSLLYRKMVINNSAELHKIYEEEKDKHLFLVNFLHNKSVFRNNELRESLHAIFSEYDHKENLGDKYRYGFKCANTVYKKSYPEWFNLKKKRQSIEKEILKKCESIVEEIKIFKESRSEFWKAIKVNFMIFICPIIAYYFTKKIALNYFSFGASTFLAIIAVITTLIIVIRKLIKEDVEKKKNI